MKAELEEIKKIMHGCLTNPCLNEGTCLGIFICSYTKASRNIYCMKLQTLQIRLLMVKANPLLESFGESPKTCVTNSSRPSAKLRGKGNPHLPSFCSNYWPPIVALSLCLNHLVLSTFQQCRSAMPKRSAKPIASIRHTVVSLEKPLV